MEEEICRREVEENGTPGEEESNTQVVEEICR